MLSALHSVRETQHSKLNTKNTEPPLQVDPICSHNLALDWKAC